MERTNLTDFFHSDPPDHNHPTHRTERARRARLPPWLRYAGFCCSRLVLVSGSRSGPQGGRLNDARDVLLRLLHSSVKSSPVSDADDRSRRPAVGVAPAPAQSAAHPPVPSPFVLPRFLDAPRPGLKLAGVGAPYRLRVEGEGGVYPVNQIRFSVGFSGILFFLSLKP